MSDTEKKEASPGLIAAIMFGIVAVFLIVGYSVMPERGDKGGKCYEDGSCNMGLRCKSQKCAVITKGALRGECRDNGNCNDGLVCNKYNFCDEKGEEPKKPKVSSGGGGLINGAKRKAGAVWRVLSN